MKEEIMEDMDAGDEPRVLVEFTPTVPTCSMGTLIGEFSATSQR